MFHVKHFMIMVVSSNNGQKTIIYAMFAASWITILGRDIDLELDGGLAG